MKTIIKNKSVLFFLLASVMMMSACSSEDGMTTAENGNPTGRVMYAKGAYNDGGNSQSRMTYADYMETNSMKLAWSSEDKFSAFINGDATNKKYDFAIQDPKNYEAYTADETFKCISFAEDVADGTVIDAIYPAVAADAVNPQNITLSLAEQAQDKNKSTLNLSDCDYMVGHATYNASKPDELDFNFRDKGDGNSGRLASIYRIRLQLPATVTAVSKIVISCTDESGEASLVTIEKVNFTNGSTSAIAATKGDVTLNITNGTPTDGEFVAYAMLFPSAVKTRTITVTATDGGVEKVYTDTKTYDSETIYTRGQFRYINADLVPRNFKSVYTDADYYQWDAYKHWESNDHADAWGVDTDTYNPSTGTATNTCADCPTQEELQLYLGAGVYYDDGTTVDANLQTYTLLDRNEYHAGLWLMKKQYIPEGTVGENAIITNMPMNVNTELYHIGRPSESEIYKYFFLPATGARWNTDEDFGKGGFYWSSTGQFETDAYYLTFGEGDIQIRANNKNIGCIPLIRE